MLSVADSSVARAKLTTMGKDTFEPAGREWPNIKWWQMKGMRFIYLTWWAAMLTSAPNGKGIPDAAALCSSEPTLVSAA